MIIDYIQPTSGEDGISPTRRSRILSATQAAGQGAQRRPSRRALPAQSRPGAADGQETDALIFVKVAASRGLDVVILLNRPDLYDRESERAGEADFDVAKHRNGPTKMIMSLSRALLAIHRYAVLASDPLMMTRGVLARGQRQTLAAARLRPPASAATDPAEIASTICGLTPRCCPRPSCRSRCASRGHPDHYPARLWEDHKLIKTHGPRGTSAPAFTEDLPMWTAALSAIRRVSPSPTAAADAGTG